MPKGYPGTGRKKTKEKPQILEEIRNEKGQFAKGNKAVGRRPVLGRSLAQLVKDIADEKIKDEDGKTVRTRLEIALRKHWLDAMQGDRQKLELLLDRGWGKVPNQVDMMDWRKQALDAGAKIEDVDVIFNKLVDEFASRISAGNAA